MKSNRLLYIIGQVDDKFIEEAAPVREKKVYKLPWKLLSVAACFVFAAVLGISIGGRLFGEHFMGTTKDKRWPEKVVSRTQSSEAETAIIPKWDEQTISQQYSEVKWNTVMYSTRQTEIKSEMIGSVLGAVTATGIDNYTDTVHTMEAAVYAINNISAECAVAVLFDGETDYYVYVNTEYQPETLGDFITDLNLKETLSFGSVYYDWKTEDKPVTTIEFVDLEASRVWEMLLSDESLKAIKDNDAMWLGDKMSVSVNIPLLGYENIGLWVTEEGYLVTNILSTAKVFDLGTEKTEQFINYVVENCEGYELVYEDSSGEIPE